MSFSLQRAAEIGADAGQYLIPIAAGVYACYKGDYSDAIGLGLLALVQKGELIFLKHAFPRERPNRADTKSFPSGHTAGAFLSVGFLAAKYGWSVPTIAALSGSIVVAASRCLSQAHWPSDVLAGSVLGMMNGSFAVLGSSMMRS
jgi:membrane-associated phospholipid phosphatase